MLDLKTLRILDEALDMALDNLLEYHALKKDSPYAKQFVKAQEKVRKEMDKLQIKHTDTRIVAKVRTHD